MSSKNCVLGLFVCVMGSLSHTAIAQCGGSSRSGFGVSNSNATSSSLPYSPGSTYGNSSFDLPTNSQRQALEMTYRNQLAQQMTLAQRNQQVASLRADAWRRQQMMVAARQARAAKQSETSSRLVSTKLQ